MLGSALPLIRDGRIRALGVSGAKRSPQLPEVPTIAEAALPGFEFEPFYALVVPARTPREIMGVLADAVAKAMSPPEFREQFFKVVGSEALFNTPEQMLEVAKKEAALIDRIVRTAHIELE